MPLSREQKERINSYLICTLEKKLNRYVRETTSMPFLSRLIQDDEKVAAYSFIHSIATTLGMSIYEQVSIIIAESNSEEIKRDFRVEGGISLSQRSAIEDIVGTLRTGSRKANKAREVEEILNTDANNKRDEKKNRKADFYMKRKSIEHYFEIKTVKPNIDVFTESKRKLLEWVARKQKNIKTILAFPYNPYEPEPYERFTEQGVLEKGEELMVGKEYWDFLGGGGTYEDLLEIFDNVGKKFREKIQNKIQEVARKKIAT